MPKGLATSLVVNQQGNDPKAGIINEHMLIALTGENSIMLQIELLQIIHAFVSEHGDMALEKLDGEEVEFDRIREALQSLPFLSSKKLVVLKSPSANKQFLEAAEGLLNDVSDSIDVVIVEPKLDKRLGYYKFLKKQKGFTEYNQLDVPQLANWSVDTVKDLGGSLSRADAVYLVERVGANQQLLYNELQKLVLYDARVSRETINLLTERTPQSTIFDLLDAALTGQKQKALQLYAEQRAMKVEPQQILALLGWQLHVMALIKSAGNRDANAIAAEAKISPYSIKKTQTLVRNMTISDVKALVHQTAELDVRLKSESIDADEALQNLFISL